MITVDHIQTFQKYDGDIDWWSRVSHVETNMTEDEWFDIQNLLQRIYMMNANLTSHEFDETLMKELKEKTDSPEAIHIMLNYKKAQGKK